MRTGIKIWAMIALTFRESVARKTFVTFVGISSLIHLFLLFVLNIEILDASMAFVQVWGEEVSGTAGFNLKDMIIKIQKGMSFAVFSGGIILSIFATAGLIPTMLEKGNVELLLSKPLSRIQLFLCRYTGALLIMMFNVTYLISGTWLILGFKTGVWHAPALYIIPMVILTFSLVYACMAFVGVLSRSSSVTVMVAFFILFLGLVLQHQDFIYGLVSMKVYYYLQAAIYHVLPKISELGQITQSLVANKPVSSWMPLWTSCIAGLSVLAATLLIFHKRDY